MSKTIEQLLEGIEGLTPEFKEKASVVFEAAVQEAVDAELAKQTTLLTEATDKRVLEAVNEADEKIMGTLDVFLNEAVSEWISENAVALDGQLKGQLAETFVEGLAKLFESHNVKFDDQTAEKVAGLEKQLAESTETLTKLQAQINEAAQAAEKAELAVLLETTVADLADTQKDRVKRLMESIEVKDAADYKKKLGFIVEAVTGVDGAKKDDEKSGDKGSEEDKGDGKGEEEKGKEAPVNEATVIPEQKQEKVLDPIVESTLAYLRKGRKAGK